MDFGKIEDGRGGWKFELKRTGNGIGRREEGVVADERCNILVCQ